MISFVRSLFGIPSSERKAVTGASENLTLKDVEITRDSSARLTVLHNLVHRYKGTPHENKIRLVYEKTKEIHSYLTMKKRHRELEVFHLQNTDHFIATFAVIIDVHQRVKSSQSHSSKTGSQIQSLLRNRLHKIPEMVKPLPQKDHFVHTEELDIQVPALSVPEITINTYSKLVYYIENASLQLIEKEIGFFSTKEEKEEFLADVATQLGIGLEGITYVGNAMVKIPNSNGETPTGYVPILHWKGFLYAINLNDYRLFPVKMHRKGR